MNLLNIITITAYVLAGTLLSVRLVRHTMDDPGRKQHILAVAMLALAGHGFVLYHQIDLASGLNLGFFNAVSFISWVIALLLVLAALFRPVENLGIAVFPLAAIALLMDHFFHSAHILPHSETGVELHVVISVTAYGLLSLAAVQAILMAIQDRQLHHQRPGGFIRALPPLQTMESLLFQMITLGFFLQSLALVSGFMFTEDLFAQHLAHKTVLSIVAWLVYATLLWGRWRHGWRGKTAIRWTMWGFVSLLLAYFGSKLVLELILRK